MLVIVVVLLLFGLVVRHKWRNGVAKKEAILRLVAVASEEESQIAKLQAIEDYNLQHKEYNSEFKEYKSQHKEYRPQHNNAQLEAQHYCAVCGSTTTTRCSRCKAARYCSGKCQIVHWRQGHREECQPALALHATKKSEHVLESAPESQCSIRLKDEKTRVWSNPSEEGGDSVSSGTATENLFAAHLKDDTKITSDHTEGFEDSRSSDSSTSCFLSSTKQSETSNDTSTNEDVEVGTHTRSAKAPSVGIDSNMTETISDFDDASVPSASYPAYSVKPPLHNNIEKTQATGIDENLKSTNLKDKQKGGRVTVKEEFVFAESELGSPQLTSSARTSSNDIWENLVQTSTSRVVKSKSAKASGNNLMPNRCLSPEYLKSSKLSQSHEFWKYENCNAKETKHLTTSMSSGKKMHTNAGSPQAISLETEGVQMLSQSTGKGLKTSVRKLAQHFRVPKQSKSYTLDMVTDSGDNNNHKVIFSMKLFMQLYSSDNVGHLPFGLVNCGNSCYANAVLQCLAFTRPITSYLLQGMHSKTCRKRDWCFICKFEHLIRKGQDTNSPKSPVGLLSHIQPIGREEDAHEFLRNVIDKMQSICLEEAGVSGSFAEDSTLIGLTFGGYLRSKIKCMRCLERSERYDRMLDLTVEIDGGIYTLEQALSQFTMSETLGGDDKYKCNKCKSYEKAKKKLTVLDAPNILTIVLKRFRSGNFEKLSKQIQFPEVLNLSPYMSGMVDKYPIYHLYGVVVHLGVMNGTYSGHYVSYVKNFQGHWFKIDDSRVSRVDLGTVLSAEAYILFYARRTPRGASFDRKSNIYSDGKTKKSTEAIPSSNNSKKRNPKTKLSSSGRSAPHWMSPNDFSSAPDTEDWEFQVKHKNHVVDSLSDSSSIFSTSSDAGSYSTDSTKDSSVEDLSGYLFGSSWYMP